MFDSLGESAGTEQCDGHAAPRASSQRTLRAYWRYCAESSERWSTHKTTQQNGSAAGFDMRLTVETFCHSLAIFGHALSACPSHTSGENSSKTIESGLRDHTSVMYELRERILRICRMTRRKDFRRGQALGFADCSVIWRRLVSERSIHRRYPRYRITLPIVHRSIPLGMNIGTGWTLDLSEGGACVKLVGPLLPQTTLQLTLRPDHGRLEVKARVAWTGVPDSIEGCTPHGLAFTQLTADQTQALRDLILSKDQVRQAAVRLPLALPVTFRRKGHSGPSLYGRTGEIGRGGLLLRLLQAFPPGMALEVTLHTRKGPLTAEGTIAWIAPPERRRPGELISHGLRFSALALPAWFSLDLAHAEFV